jgi:hypothetical protein
VAKDFRQSYRAYLHEVEAEGRQTLSVLSLGILCLSLLHPLLLLLTVPSTALAWWALFRESRVAFTKQFLGGRVLRRMLRFDDYDPDFADSFEAGDEEGTLRIKNSKLEHLWRSYEASCRTYERQSLTGYRHIAWMILPLVVLTCGLLLLAPLSARWNWLPLIQPDEAYWLGILQIVAWLLGIFAATLAKFVIQVALVSAAWDAVVTMPLDDPDAAADSATGPRDAVITWHLPGEAARLARQNGIPQ